MKTIRDLLPLRSLGALLLAIGLLTGCGSVSEDTLVEQPVSAQSSELGVRDCLARYNQCIGRCGRITDPEGNTICQSDCTVAFYICLDRPPVQE